MSRVWGCDVSKNFLVFYDGSCCMVYIDSAKALKTAKKLPSNALVQTHLKEIVKNGDIVILEQTGSYGIRYAKLLQDLGCTVYIADGKAFKRFRGGKNRSKNDFVDAKYLRKMFLHEPEEEDEEDWRKFIYPFNYERYRLRTLIRHKIRLEKDLTRFINRLRQLLADLLSSKNYYDENRKKLLKELPQIKEELQSIEDPLKIAGITEIEKIETTLKAIELTEKEIRKIIEKHPDYEILKSFPNFGDMAIAVLIAYYWDIKLFHSKDSFISYVLMGTKTEQSGTSVNSNRTDKTRTEVKAILYMIYLLSFRDSSVLKPLTAWLRRHYTGKHQNKKRFIKFAQKILELVFYALKHRIPFIEALNLTISNMEKQLQSLEKISFDENRIQEYRFPENFWIRLSRLKSLLPVYKDIASRVWKRAEIITGKKDESHKQNKELTDEKSNLDMEQTGTYKTLKVQDGGIWRAYKSQNSGDLPQSVYRTFKRGSFRKG